MNKKCKNQYSYGCIDQSLVYIIKTKVHFGNMDNCINENCLETYIAIFLLLSFIYAFSHYIYN